MEAIVPTGPDPRIDSLVPMNVACPATAEEAALTLSDARAAGQAVIPMGGGTTLHIGAPPSRYNLALSSRRLDGLLEYSPADLTVVVRAGTTLQELDIELARHGQFLPLQPPVPDRATVGGALAGIVGSPWRLAYGTGRDMTIGMRMALPSGEIAKTGGKVVKNVAGYDMAKLFIGSHGTLGVIVEAAFKLYPRPPLTRTLIYSTDQDAASFHLAKTLKAAGPGLLMLAVVNARFATALGLGHGGVIATVGGSRGAVEDLVKRLTAEGGREALTASEEAAHRIHAYLRDFPAIAEMRVSTIPSSTGKVLSDRATDELLSYPSLGLSFLRTETLDDATVLGLREQVAAVGGHVTLLRALPETKRRVGVWTALGPEIALMRKVKDVFDPETVMSPGRFVGGL